MANETLATILQNQNTYIQNGETARQALDTKVTNATTQLINDDNALTKIKGDVESTMKQLDNDDNALTLINTRLISALTNLDELSHRVYGFQHDYLVTDNLESDYKLITQGGYRRVASMPLDWETDYFKYYYISDAVYTPNDSIEWDFNKEYYKYYEPHALGNKTAIGMIAILTDNDIVITGDTYDLYINAEKETQGYTFHSDNSSKGMEIVKIWYFQKGETALSVTRGSYTVLAIIEKTKANTAPNLDSSFYNYVNSITYDIIPSVAPTAVRKQINTGTTPDDNISTTAEEYSNSMQTIGGTYATLINNSTLKTIIFPNATTIVANPSYFSKRRCFSGCVNATVYMPKLQQINTTPVVATAPFRQTGTVILPETLESISASAFANNRKLVLNCKKAVIDDNWYCTRPIEGDNPSAPRDMEICSDWNASINLAYVGTCWDVDTYTSWLDNDDNLHNAGFTTVANTGDADYDSATGKYVPNTSNTGEYKTSRYFTIPSAIFTSLSEEIIDKAFQKGWKIQGG